MSPRNALLCALIALFVAAAIAEVADVTAADDASLDALQEELFTAVERAPVTVTAEDEKKVEAESEADIQAEPVDMEVRAKVIEAVRQTAEGRVQLADNIMPSDLAPNDLELSEFNTANQRQCYAVGDPHFQSFDGQIFHFQGVGQFLLSRSKDLEVQGRTFPCGGAVGGYYGLVACYNAAAVKFTNHGCADVVQIGTTGGQEILLNGHAPPAGQSTSFTTKCGLSVVPVVKTVVNAGVTSSYREITISTPLGDGAIITTYAIYIWEKKDKKTTGLCGNNNGNPADDLTFFNGKKTLTCPTTADCVDDNIAKPLHAWGLSYMVDDKKIKSIFDDAAAKYDKPLYKPEAPHWPNAEARAKADAVCKNKASSYKFYRDCMMDIKGSGNLNFAKTDAESEVVFDAMEHKDANRNPAKVKMARILIKMEIDYMAERDRLLDEQELQHTELANLTTNRLTFEKKRDAHCKNADRISAHYNVEKAKQDKAKGGLDFVQAAYTRAVVRSHRDRSAAVREIGLTKELLVLLDKLKNCHTCATQLAEIRTINHAALRQEPKLAHTFQTLIQKVSDGHTDGIKSLLDNLIVKLEAEIREIDKDVADNKVALRRHRNLYNARLATATAVLHQRDAEAKKCADLKQFVDTSASKAAALLVTMGKDAVTRIKQMAELRGDADMAKSLATTVQNWSASKKFKKCTPALLEEDDDDEDDDSDSDDDSDEESDDSLEDEPKSDDKEVDAKNDEDVEDEDEEDDEDVEDQEDDDDEDDDDIDEQEDDEAEENEEEEN